MLIFYNIKRNIAQNLVAKLRNVIAYHTFHTTPHYSIAYHSITLFNRCTNPFYYIVPHASLTFSRSSPHFSSHKTGILLAILSWSKFLHLNLLLLCDLGIICTMADSGRHFFIKDIVILYKVLSIFVVKSQLNWQCHTYMYNSCTDNFH